MFKEKRDAIESHSSPKLNRRTFLGRSAGLGIAATAATGLFGRTSTNPTINDRKLFLIGLEEHFTTPELQALQASADERLFSGGRRRPELSEVGAGRIKDMDEAGIDIQVLSTVTPGVQNLPNDDAVSYARKLNTWVAQEVVGSWPERFRAFATIPLSQPNAAADELERSVLEYDFVGCMTYGPIHGKFLDHEDFRPVLERAQALRVPIYIHPNWPSSKVTEFYYENLGDDLVSRILGGPGYGWHQEVALQCLRLIVSGVFDRFPELQVVVGHMGEGLPFYYWRVGEDLDRIVGQRLQKSVQQYFHDNLWITTSAFFRDELLNLAISTMGEDRIMFSIDYPMANAKAGADWFRAVDLPFETMQKIGHLNAARLLNIELT